MNNVEKIDTVEFIIFTDLFTLAVLHLEHDEAIDFSPGETYRITGFVEFCQLYHVRY